MMSVHVFSLTCLRTGQTECLNILLQRCPDIEVDARNTLGFTPLMKAALQGRTKCAKILLFAGEFKRAMKIRYLINSKIGAFTDKI